MASELMEPWNMPGVRVSGPERPEEWMMTSGSQWRAGEVAGAGGYTLLFPSLSAWALSSWFAVLL